MTFTVIGANEKSRPNPTLLFLLCIPVPYYNHNESPCIGASTYNCYYNDDTSL